MAYYFPHQQQPQHQQGTSHLGSHSSHHGGRARRAPRASSQNSHRQFRGVRSMKELTDAPTYNVFIQRLESSKGFELDDDLEFCPGLLTEDDIQSISSSSSDRSSLSSGSPSTSPTQSHAHPAAQISPPFQIAQTYQPSHYNHQMQNPPPQQQPIKIHQPSALRTRSAIPIVDPTTMQRVASPPQSISPARMQQQTYLRRGW